MEVRLGEIGARCPDCGGAEFVATAIEDELACKNCSRSMTRTQLLMQIGDQAARDAAESLARLRKDRPAGTRKPR
jgi:hypothetical protein